MDEDTVRDEVEWKGKIHVSDLTYVEYRRRWRKKRSYIIDKWFMGIYTRSICIVRINNYNKYQNIGITRFRLEFNCVRLVNIRNYYTTVFKFLKTNIRSIFQTWMTHFQMRWLCEKYRKENKSELRFRAVC